MKDKKINVSSSNLEKTSTDHLLKKIYDKLKGFEDFKAEMITMKNKIEPKIEQIEKKNMELTDSSYELFNSINDEKNKISVILENIKTLENNIIKIANLEKEDIQSIKLLKEEFETAQKNNEALIQIRELTQKNENLESIIMQNKSEIKAITEEISSFKEEVVKAIDNKYSNEIKALKEQVERQKEIIDALLKIKEVSEIEKLQAKVKNMTEQNQAYERNEELNDITINSAKEGKIILGNSSFKESFEISTSSLMKNNPINNSQDNFLSVSNKTQNDNEIQHPIKDPTVLMNSSKASEDSIFHNMNYNNNYTNNSSFEGSSIPFHNVNCNSSSEGSNLPSQIKEDSREEQLHVNVNNEEESFKRKIKFNKRILNLSMVCEQENESEKDSKKERRLNTERNEKDNKKIYNFLHREEEQSSNGSEIKVIMDNQY